MVAQDMGNDRRMAQAAMKGSGRGSGSSPQALEEAIAWMVRLQSHDDDTTRTRCAQWRAADPEHEQAWLQLSDLTDQWPVLPAMPAGIASAAVDLALARKQRRRAFKLLGLAGIGIGAWLTVRQTIDWRHWRAEHTAARGERRRIVLEDGTQLFLNTATSVALDFRPDARRILLQEGEIYLETGPDAKQPGYRPLSVRSRSGEFVALGTRFLVRQEPDFALLQVDEGRVALIGHVHADGAPLIASPGQRYRVSVGDAQAVSDAEASGLALTGWIDGVLEVHDMRLADFIDEAERYRRGWISCDPAVAEWRLSGVFRLDDMDEMLRSLQRTLPIRIEVRWGYWVRIHPKG